MNDKFFLLEFTEYAWLVISIAYTFLVIFIAVILYILLKFGIEKNPHKETKFKYALKLSYNICLKAFINKNISSGNKSVTYKLLITVIMILCFIILSHYRAQMNAALNFYVEEFPINSWEDVDKSNYKILTWPGSVLVSKFKDSKRSIMRNIYQEKIATVDEQINTIGYQETVSRIIRQKYIAVDILETYMAFEEFPCKITSIKTLE